MSIKDYAGHYDSYEHMIRHAEHHGSGVDLDYDGAKEIVSLYDKVEELQRENKRLKELLDMANYAVWHDRM